MVSPPKSAYRRDIDGLRAIAVLSVILCHAGFEGFAGGYVGVDVFFVISGFLITAIVIDDCQAERFSLLRFYERRIRRILPALFAMLLIITPIVALVMLPSQLDQFTRGLLSILIFASNVFFWKNVDYFSAPAESNPLIHTWSLAVEEQFYLFLPLLIWGLSKLGLKCRGIGLIVLALCLASLAIAQWAWPRYPSPNYYLLPSRAWELGTGSLAACLIRRRTHRPRPLLALGGIVAICAAVLLYDADTPFPSLYALLPVLGAGAILLYGQSAMPEAAAPLASKILCLPSLTLIGLISYSAYLWHQPIFAFARMLSISRPGPVVMAALIVLSLAAGYLSWRFIEAPFRKHSGAPGLLPDLPRLFGAAGAGAALIAALATVGIRTQGFEQSWRLRHSDYPALIEALNYTGSPDHRRQFLEGGCFGPQALPGHCLKISADQRNYLILGDSFAAQYAVALRDRFAEDNVMELATPGCRPVWNGRGTANCLAMYHALDAFLQQPEHRPAGIILAAHWRSVEAPDLARTIARLQDMGIPVAVIGPSPEYGAPLPELLFRIVSSMPKAQDNAMWDRALIPLEARFEATAKAAGAGFVPVLSGLCPTGRCPNYAQDGTVLQFDYGHFTLSGVRTVIAELFPARLADLFPPLTAGQQDRRQAAN